jgi:uncharacterized phage-like protein YoqJ
MLKSEIKAQVIKLVAQKEKSETIAKQLGISFNQVKAIRYGKTYQKQIEVVDTRSPQEKAWDKRRENEAKKVEVNVGVVKKKVKKEQKSIPITKKQVIRIGNITIEFEKDTTKRVITGLDGSITII